MDGGHSGGLLGYPERSGAERVVPGQRFQSVADDQRPEPVPAEDIQETVDRRLIYY